MLDTPGLHLINIMQCYRCNGARANRTIVPNSTVLYQVANDREDGASKFQFRELTMIAGHIRSGPARSEYSS